MAGFSEGGGGGGDGEEACCGVGDTSPGTIVWVRRRNGSWWPGRILGPDELPPSQIMSPRSGTPVKLLGREDASVDWYNIEKSKRVKAFRCGEFDACIEKAEATEGTSVKKREKYARREDAILHALELEKKLLASKHQTQSSIPANISVCSKHNKDLGSTRYKSKKSKKRKGASASSDVKKEPEQYVLHAGSKRNFSDSPTRGSSENPFGNNLGDISHVRHIQAGASLESKEIITTTEKIRSDGSDFDESIEKCDKHQPLVQVLQSSPKLPHQSPHSDDYGDVLTQVEMDRSPANYRAKRSRYIFLPTDSGETYSHSDLPTVQVASTGGDFETESYLHYPASLSEEQTSSDLVEKHISESSERECSESETEDDAELLRSSNLIVRPALHAHDPYFLPASDEFRHVNIDAHADELTYSSYMCRVNESEEDGSSDPGVSQWHMKGKRNIRSAPKRSDMTDGNPWLDKSDGFTEGSPHEINGRNPIQGSVQISNQQSPGQNFYQIKEELSYDSDETDFFEDTGHSEVNLYHGRTYSSCLKATRDFSRSYSYFNDYGNDSSKTSPLNRDSDKIFHFDRNAYWNGSSFYQKYSSRLGGMGPMLFDVDLKVQASYQGEHVPLVSLMSRLNGKAIVGHPVQIEIVEDGSTDHLVSCGDISLEGRTGGQPAWFKGRRTAMQRIPRSNPSGASLDGDDEGSLAYEDWEMKPDFRKYSTSNNQVKKSNSNVRRSPAFKSQKKPSKKANLSNQKVRTLSSISTGKRHHGPGHAKARRDTGIFGGLIKLGGAVPLVTCVPAKVVFTRILEAVGRPPLAVAHRVRMASPALRNPS
uniref:PWWP domain-containing protein n=1 Tax=Leersia perrieri TaxID=77586 RepID=A0A0D9VJV4_9ORYZ